jgi:hypothetical protein
MRIDIVLPSEVTIPDDQLLHLAKRIRERFEMDDDAPVGGHDLVAEAILAGLLNGDEFSGWEVAPHEDQEYTDEELRAIQREATEKHSATIRKGRHGKQKT